MKKFLILTLASLAIATTSQAQTYSHDVSLVGGIALNQSFRQIENFGLMYRFGLNETLKLKAGYTLDGDYRDVPVYDPYIFVSDTLLIQRSQYSSGANHLLRFGLDFESGDHFIFGGSLLAGYKSELMAQIDQGDRYDPEQKRWVSCGECVYDYYGEDQPFYEQDNGSINQRQFVYGRFNSKTEFVQFGLELNAGIRVPLRNRFEITAQYTPQLIHNRVFNTEIYHTPTEGSYTLSTDSFTEVRHRVMAALRFKF